MNVFRFFRIKSPILSSKLVWCLLNLKLINFLEKTFEIKPLKLNLHPYGTHYVKITTEDLAPTNSDIQRVMEIQDNWYRLWPKIKAELNAVLLAYSSRNTLEELLSKNNNLIISIDSEATEDWSFVIILIESKNAHDYYVALSGSEVMQSGAGF